MNNTFVYKGILVMFDNEIGYFFHLDGCKVSFKVKQKCLDFISGLSDGK